MDIAPLQLIDIIIVGLTLTIGSIATYFVYRQNERKLSSNPIGSEGMSVIGSTFASRDGVVQQLEANERYTLALKAHTMAVDRQTDVMERSERADSERAKSVAQAASRSADALEAFLRVGLDIKSQIERGAQR